MSGWQTTFRRSRSGFADRRVLQWPTKDSWTAFDYSHVTFSIKRAKSESIRSLSLGFGRLVYYLQSKATVKGRTTTARICHQCRDTFWLVDLGFKPRVQIRGHLHQAVSSCWFSKLEISGPGLPDTESIDWRLKWLI